MLFFFLQKAEEATLISDKVDFTAMIKDQSNRKTE